MRVFLCPLSQFWKAPKMLKKNLNDTGALKTGILYAHSALYRNFPLWARGVRLISLLLLFIKSVLVVMFTENFTLEIVVVTYLYMIVYNFSLLLFFFVLFQVMQGDLKSMGSLGKLNLDSIKISTLVISICSMAGVPPLFGFFTKLLVMVVVSNSSFPFLFSFFLSLLLVSLFFYVQNVRFLYNDSLSFISNNFSREASSSIIMISSEQFLCFLLVFGIFLYDDLLSALFWVIV